MTKTEKIFWIILRAGLWGKEPSMITEPLKSKEWIKIGEMAKRQTVLNLIFDGISFLPESLQPEKEIKRKWLASVIKTEQIHLRQNHVLAKIVGRFNDENVRTMLLKGESNAILYDNPLRRQSGDIDLFVGREQYPKTCELVRQWGIVNDERENNKHLEFTWEEVPIEIHRIVATSFSKKFNREMIKWSEEVLWDTSTRFIPKDEETSILTGTPTFNAIYIFYHLLNHFLTRGVGLRQLCDLARCMHTYHKDIDKDELQKRLQLFGIFLPWKVFGYILVHKIGLPKDEFPFYSPMVKQKAFKVLIIIEKEGNFGKYSALASHRPKNYIAGKLFSFRERTKKYLTLMRLFPALTFHYLWNFLIGGTIHVVLDRDTDKS